MSRPDAYDSLMGRYSVPLAPRFHATVAADWLYRKYRRGPLLIVSRPPDRPQALFLSGTLWRDVDLANGRIQIGRSKTQAGLREIILLPILRDELATHNADAYRAGADDPVFPTGTGGVRVDRGLRRRGPNSCL